MNQRERETLVSLSVIAAGLTIVAAIILLTGCRTCEPQIIKEPTVVEVPVSVPPPLLPTPRPPSLSLPDARPESRSIIEAIAADWHELVRAYREALAIITEHNRAVNEPPG